MAHEEKFAVEAEGHASRRGRRTQAGDLRQVGAIKDQQLIPILAQYVKAIPHWIGQQIDQCSGNVYGSAPLVRALIVHKQADRRRQIDGFGGRDLEHSGRGAELVLEASRIDLNLDGGRGAAGGRADGHAGQVRAERKGSLPAARIDQLERLGNYTALGRLH